MDDRVKQRIAYALKCKVSEVPETQEGIKTALDEKLAELREVKHGKSIHQPL